MMSDISAFVDLVVDGLPATDMRLEQIRTHHQEDETCKLLSMYVADGWPERNALAGTLQQYWPYRSDLTIQHGLLMYSTRIVIPSVLRLEMLDRIHDGHQGIVKCRRRAKDSIWWPGLSRGMEDLVRQCRVCCQNTIPHPEPLEPSELPSRPWQKVATDLMDFKQSHYLVVVDFHSRYIELALLEKTTSSAGISHMQSIFTHLGLHSIRQHE